LDEFTVDKDIEACAIHLTFNPPMKEKLCILNIYRSPRGNFTNFLEKLDRIMQKLFNGKYNIIICGDINVTYLNEDNRKKQLDIVLQSYNLTSIVTFPTRVDMSSSTIIDNFFVDTTSTGKYDIYPCINGLSDHDAQVLILHNIKKHGKEYCTYMKRRINKDTITDFQIRLSYETWETVFDEKDVNNSFNIFLNNFLRIYYSSFPLIQHKCIQKKNSWITPGIIKSCKQKREICNEVRNNNNPSLTLYYVKYSKILTAVIKQAKKMEYDKQIFNSCNKIKTTWASYTMKRVEIQTEWK
jgi:hypothetical protein